MLARARVPLEDPTGEGSISKRIYMITGRIQVLDTYSYLCEFLQHGSLLHETHRERERESQWARWGVIIPYNIISRVTLVQHCNVLLDRDKLLKLRVWFWYQVWSVGFPIAPRNFQYLLAVLLFNSIGFWHNLPGGNIGSHRLRAQSSNTAPSLTPSETNHKSSKSPVLLADWL